MRVLGRRRRSYEVCGMIGPIQMAVDVEIEHREGGLKSSADASCRFTPRNDGKCTQGKRRVRIVQWKSRLDWT